MPTERSENSDDQNTKKLSIREQRTNSRINQTNKSKFKSWGGHDEILPRQFSLAQSIKKCSK